MPGIIKSDIAIIGAGPAGITATMALSKKGIDTILIDKNQFPRDKICGDCLSGKAISTLNKINPDLFTELVKSGLATGSHAVRFYSPELKMIELGYDSGNPEIPPGLICRRVELDHFLLSKALASKNTSFKGGITISDIRRQNGQVILTDHEGKPVVETRLVLVAAGFTQHLIHQLDASFPVDQENGLAVRGYFEKVEGSSKHYPIEIHFLKELLPCYFWIFFFADGSANVGLAMPVSLAKKSQMSLKKRLFHILDTYPQLKKRFANARLTGKIEASQLPIYNGPEKIAGDNYMLLGDAARLIDPFTGEGIGNAMVSGYLAGEFAARCLEKNDFTINTTIDYEQAVYQKLKSELDLSLGMQKKAYSKRLINLVVRKASKSETIRSLLVEMMYSHVAKKKLKNPVFYLKLLLGL
jgi:geranylgeranyl reductase family protein